MKNKTRTKITHYNNGVVSRSHNRRISILKSGLGGKYSLITLAKYHDHKISKDSYEHVITVFRDRVSALNFVLDEESLILLYDTITRVLIDKGILQDTPYNSLKRRLSSIIQDVGQMTTK